MGLDAAVLQTQCIHFSADLCTLQAFSILCNDAAEGVCADDLPQRGIGIQFFKLGVGSGCILSFRFVVLISYLSLTMQ
jgi:hypothetical protein